MSKQVQRAASSAQRAPAAHPSGMARTSACRPWGDREVGWQAESPSASNEHRNRTMVSAVLLQPEQIGIGFRCSTMRQMPGGVREANASSQSGGASLNVSGVIGVARRAATPSTQERSLPSPLGPFSQSR